MNAAALATSLGYAVSIGIVAGILCCAAAGAIVAFAFLGARRR
jgi:hypothetical protein